MANLITTPVELGFTDFVGKLISDTFDAILTSQASQEERWIELRELLGKSTEDFANEIVSDDAVTAFMIELFPNGDGGHVIEAGLPYQAENLRKGLVESPPVFLTFGYKPSGKKLTNGDVLAIRQLAKNEISQKQFEVLSALLNKGNTRVIVDGGKINAKMTFNILQVEDEEESSSSTTASTVANSVRSNFVLSKSVLSYASLAKPLALKNIHFFVKPTSDKDPQSSTVKANIYSEVEIQFKTIS